MMALKGSLLGLPILDEEHGGSMQNAICIDAFESSAACVRGLGAHEAVARRLYWKVTRASPTALVLSRHAVVDKMECLPDTVDPRGPKTR